LNIIKKRTEVMAIEKLQNNEVKAEGQIEVQNMVKAFYSNLYAARDDLATNYDSFYPSDLPKLTPEENKKLDAPFSLAEVRGGLLSPCYQKRVKIKHKSVTGGLLRLQIAT